MRRPWSICSSVLCSSRDIVPPPQALFTSDVDAAVARRRAWRTAASTCALSVTSVATNDARHAELVLQLPGRRRAGLLVALGHHDRGALAGHPPGDPEADALPGAGDQRDLPLESSPSTSFLRYSHDARNCLRRESSTDREIDARRTPLPVADEERIDDALAALFRLAGDPRLHERRLARPAPAISATGHRLLDRLTEHGAGLRLPAGRGAPAHPAHRQPPAAAARAARLRRRGHDDPTDGRVVTYACTPAGRAALSAASAR